MAKQKQKQKQKNLTSREIESVITRKFSTKKSLGPYVITDDEKKNECLPFATTWMDLEGIMLSEMKQRKTNTVITYMWNLKK